MIEINTKIFKPQKWVLDVLNSPKGETVEFEINSNTESFIKISDKVPEDMGNAIYFYVYSSDDGVNFSSDILTEIIPSVYITDGLLILTDNVDGKSKGIYFSEEVYEMFKEFGVTEFYLRLQTTQDFSISKKIIEGVHPIEEKYIPGGSKTVTWFVNYNHDGPWYELFNTDSEIVSEEEYHNVYSDVVNRRANLELIWNCDVISGNNLDNSYNNEALYMDSSHRPVSIIFTLTGVYNIGYVNENFITFDKTFNFISDDGDKYSYIVFAHFKLTDYYQEGRVAYDEISFMKTGFNHDNPA